MGLRISFVENILPNSVRKETMERSSMLCAHNFCLEDVFCVLKYVRIGNICLIRVLEHVDMSSM